MARRARAPLRSIDLMVLAVLQAEPRHGYGIVQAIEELTDGRISLRPGDVYRVLYRMHRDALLEPVGRAPVAEDGDERRTYYRITGQGRRVAAAEADMLAGVSAHILGARGAATRVEP